MATRKSTKTAATAAPKHTCPKGHELEEAKGMLHCRPCNHWQNAPQ